MNAPDLEFIELDKKPIMLTEIHLELLAEAEPSVYLIYV